MTLDHIWAGWRSAYVGSVPQGSSGPPSNPEQGSIHGNAAGPGAGHPCVFCEIAAANGASGIGDEKALVVWRSPLCLAVLNAYPYASGHLLVMPVRHLGSLGELDKEESSELWEATTDAVSAISSAYDPDGVNFGANLGRAAGAGLPDHLHIHVLPRWIGDTNFMTTVAGVRVMPEALQESWLKLSRAWPKRA
ncbi:MAG: HIT domain-containing protein [Actinobacteria bacterium]|nr:HIT domain-containing protein [Actinomycetota bacterium]